MNSAADARPIEIYTTCPAFRATGQPVRPGYYDDSGAPHTEHIVDVARWSEECGCKGILVYIDNSLLDNWSVAQIIIENTRTLIPLIATQPAYMHPAWIAKKIATLGHLYGRPIALNMLALPIIIGWSIFNSSFKRIKFYPCIVFVICTGVFTI